jgi:UDP-N-acetylmuramoylalanine--D-glutamate ligase
MNTNDIHDQDPRLPPDGVQVAQPLQVPQEHQQDAPLPEVLVDEVTVSDAVAPEEQVVSEESVAAPAPVVKSSARELPTTLTAARDAADFVARIFAEDTPAAVAQGSSEAEGFAQVKEEPAERAGDTEQSPLPQSFPTATMQGQNILILGLGASGLAMARWCVRYGAASVTVADTREAPPQLTSLQQELPQVRFVSGAFHAALVEGQNLHAVYRSPGLSPEEFAPVLGAAHAIGISVSGELSLYSQALAALQTAYNYTPAILAITGTNGKTTVTSLTGQLIAHAGKSVAVAGNIGPTLLDTLTAHIDANTLPDVWVLELSSFQLDSAAGFEPTAAVVLNVTQDHLDWHGSMQAYAAAKARIFGQKALMVLNRDDKVVIAMLPEPIRAKLQKPQWRTYATFGTDMPQRPGDFGLEDVNGMVWLVRALEADETVKKRKDSEEELHFQRLMPADALRIRGRHNASNALAALALCASAGCALAPILFGLREYRGEPHRVEPVGIINGVEFLDDSKGTNVGATAAALKGLGEGCKVVVILGGEGKGQDFAPLASAVARYVRAVVLIGRDAPLIRAALEDTGVTLLDATGMEEAVLLANTKAHAGDAVLMSPACASFDMFDNYEHRARVFVAAVRDLALSVGVDLEITA